MMVRRRNQWGLRAFGTLAVVALLVGAPSAKASEPPDTTTADLPLVEVPAKADRGIIAVHLTGDGGYYLVAWHARQFVAIGYSFGADVMPYLLNRLSPHLRSRLQPVVLSGPTDQ